MGPTIHKVSIAVLALLIVGCAATPELDRLAAINRTLYFDASMNCQQHVAAVKSSLLREPSWVVEDIYSCPDFLFRRTGACHVAALVSTPSGRQFVVDNGAILRSASLAVYGVIDADTFQAVLGDEPTWTGANARREMTAHVRTSITKN